MNWIELASWKYLQGNFKGNLKGENTNPTKKLPAFFFSNHWIASTSCPNSLIQPLDHTIPKSFKRFYTLEVEQFAPENVPFPKGKYRLPTIIFRRGENVKLREGNGWPTWLCGGFLKWWVSPTNPWGSPTKNGSFWCVLVYHHLRKHPCDSATMVPNQHKNKGCESPRCSVDPESNLLLGLT